MGAFFRFDHHHWRSYKSTDALGHHHNHNQPFNFRSYTMCSDTFLSLNTHYHLHPHYDEFQEPDRHFSTSGPGKCGAFGPPCRVCSLAESWSFTSTLLPPSPHIHRISYIETCLFVLAAAPHEGASSSISWTKSTRNGNNLWQHKI